VNGCGQVFAFQFAAAMDFPSALSQMNNGGQLRWTEAEEVVRLAREAGMSTIEIVRHLCRGVPYQEAQEIAKDYAPLLGITIREFLDLRRNG
jgi:hypothetical protein